MTIEKTILKTLQEADEKVERAEELEQSAIKIQKDAANSRDESDGLLAKARTERSTMDGLHTAKEADFKRREGQLKNREVTLLAGQADLERKSAGHNKDFDSQHAELDARTVALDKSVRHNKEHFEELAEKTLKYKEIAKLISKAV